tara:strand:+ start:1219 stop:2517 length:1299 start_codon:yes stop_codon:yes gene_type:complete
MTDDIINAKKILDINRRENYTIPSNNLYPHQWSWDSAWIIYGYCITKEFEKAEKEMYSLFNYQWFNGLVPSIVFHNLDNNTYFPGPDIWELNLTAKHLTKNITSTGIVQPPLHASACLKLFEYSNNKDFLIKIYPKLLKWHKYLYNERDIHDEGLVYIRHPWESGMDNSPIWDESLNRIKISEYKYSKLRTDNKKVNAEERPTDITYERYLNLIELFKECKFNEQLIYEKSEFIIQDVLFNSLLLNSNYALLQIAKILDKKNDILLINYWINKTTFSFENKLFKNDFYYDFDLKANKIVEIKTISGLSSILICKEYEKIKNTLESNFLDIKSDNYNISSLDRNHNSFNSINYWRGPMWINLSWLIINGLQKYKYFDLSSKIKENCIKKIKEIGYYEYFDSNDTENKLTAGCGDNSFSWTAAILICMLTDIQL